MTEKWQLILYQNKCLKMSINNREQDSKMYKMDDTAPKNVKQEKDIGVTVNEQLKFEDHIYERIKKGNNMVGLI